MGVGVDMFLGLCEECDSVQVWCGAVWGCLGGREGACGGLRMRCSGEGGLLQRVCAYACMILRTRARACVGVFAHRVCTRVHAYSPSLCTIPPIITPTLSPLTSRPQEVASLYALVQNDINPQRILTQTLSDLPSLTRSMLLGWSDRILSS